MNQDLRSVGAKCATVTRSLGLAIPLLFGVALSVQAAPTILIEDFNDGNDDGWFHFDGMADQPFGPAMFDASTGEYRLGSTGLITNSGVLGTSDMASGWAASSDPVYSNGFLRTKFRITGNSTSTTFLMRASPDANGRWSFYAFGAVSSDTGFPIPRGPNPGGVVFFEKILPSGEAYMRRLHPPVDVPHLNEDWMLEAGVVGDQITMKWWPAGEPEPAEPRIRWTDPNPLPAGLFGTRIYISPRNVAQHGTTAPWRIGATIDDIYFTFPRHDDPSTLAPYDIYLWESPMPVPQVEGPFFVDGSPEKPDMRGDVTPAESWPDLRITGQVTDLNGQPIPGLKLDFWQPDDQGSYDNSGGYDLRGHLFTDEVGNYELWTVMPANYESIRTRHLHAKIGGENQGFDSWAYTTQVYFPEPYDNDVDADGVVDKVIEGGVLTDLDAIALKDDFIALADVQEAGAEFSDLAANILTLNNDPLADGYFDTTLNFMMPDVFQAPGPLRLPGDVDGDGSVAFADFLILSNHFGMDVDPYSLGDLNGDGNVAFADFLILSDNFGNMINAVATVPEPSAAAILGFAVLLIGLVRRGTTRTDAQ